MHNIVLHISIYLFPWLHVLCDLSQFNNARKHAILAIIIAVFFFGTNGCQYTDLYSHQFFLMVIKIFPEFRHKSVE